MADLNDSYPIDSQALWVTIDRCQSPTKKGTQCTRSPSAKYGKLCTQHGRMQDAADTGTNCEALTRAGIQCSRDKKKGRGRLCSQHWQMLDNCLAVTSSCSRRHGSTRCSRKKKTEEFCTQHQQMVDGGKVCCPYVLVKYTTDCPWQELERVKPLKFVSRKQSTTQKAKDGGVNTAAPATQLPTPPPEAMGTSSPELHDDEMVFVMDIPAMPPPEAAVTPVSEFSGDETSGADPTTKASYGTSYQFQPGHTQLPTPPPEEATAISRPALLDNDDMTLTTTATPAPDFTSQAANGTSPQSNHSTSTTAPPSSRGPKVDAAVSQILTPNGSAACSLPDTPRTQHQSSPTTAHSALTPAQEAYKKSFPRGHELIVTPGDKLLCGLYALKRSMRAMAFSGEDLPSVKALRKIWANNPYIQEKRLEAFSYNEDYNEDNFAEGQLALLLQAWGQKIYCTLQLGIFLKTKDVDSPTIWLSPIPDPENAEIIWVHNNNATDPDKGVGYSHWSGMRPKRSYRRSDRLKKVAAV